MPPKEDNTSKSFSEKLAKTRDKVGKEYLTDEDILILACGGIMTTYTRDEKEYK